MQLTLSNFSVLDVTGSKRVFRYIVIGIDGTSSIKKVRLSRSFLKVPQHEEDLASLSKLRLSSTQAIIPVV